ncbi:unnamed protein product [Macrosiphum euphorbiae]|uniref:Uncharacterized protein n=1 Tax=Macrosiphum euphorbiae TaxID=13131 RepID=A0AAV0XK03_9HEMI|nr:unnamed protein product [Macrosiphum euphorbiae]
MRTDDKSFATDVVSTQSHFKTFFLNMDAEADYGDASTAVHVRLSRRARTRKPEHRMRPEVGVYNNNN